MEIKKKKRYVNKKYIEFIKKQPCCVTGHQWGAQDPHHTKSRGSGGSDLTCVPLIHRLHVECEQIGNKTFQKKYDINFKVIQFELLQKFVEEGGYD